MLLFLPAFSALLNYKGLWGYLHDPLQNILSLHERKFKRQLKELECVEKSRSSRRLLLLLEQPFFYNYTNIRL
jgi:hypothetical protein